MAADLVEINERIVIAQADIVPLEADAKRFCQRSIQLIRRPRIRDVADRPGDPAELDFIVRQNDAVPVRLRSKAGTIANELRACLDALACALAVRNGKSDKGVYFPISKSKAIFEEDGMRKKIRKLSDADKAAIADLKPYRGDGGDNLLFGLHEADRVRKHVRLGAFGTANAAGAFGGGCMHVGGGAMMSIERSIMNGIPIHHMNYWSGRELKQVGQEVEIATGVPEPLPFQLEVGVCYSEPEEIAGQEVVTTLNAFSAKVSHVVGLFR